MPIDGRATLPTRTMNIHDTPRGTRMMWLPSVKAIWAAGPRHRVHGEERRQSGYRNQSSGRSGAGHPPLRMIAGAVGLMTAS